MVLRSLNLGRVASLLILGSSALVAQGVQYATISGVVRTAAGSPINGARVTIKTGQGDRTVTTDATGSYRFTQLVPQSGVRLVVSANGFVGAGAETRANVGITNVLDFSLRPIQAVGATVEVVAASTALDTTEAKSGANFSLDSVNSLPVNTRDIATIARLSPGTSSDSNGVTIRGSQATQVQYLVDGADVMDPVTGGAGVRLNEEMLEEVQVISGGVSAEYGRFTGGVVNTVTKSGSNEFKGVLRLEATNLSWNAYNPLNRGSNGRTTFANHNSIIQNFVVSGPILKDKVFFVVGYRTTSPMTSTAGTTNASAADGGGVGYATTRSETRKDIKLDYQINPSNKVYWQYNKTETKRKNIDYPSQFGYESTSIATLSSQDDNFSYTTFGYLGQLTNTLMLDIRMNNKQETLGKTGGGQGPANAPQWIDVNNYTVYDNGFFAAGGDSRPIKTANISLTKFAEGAGSHEIKVGYQWFQSSRNSANAQTPSNFIVWYNGRTAPGADLSNWHNRQVDLNSPHTSYLEWYEPITGATTKNTVQGLFVNDKWKLNKNWSFNLGVRWDGFKSQDDLGRSNYSISDFSPRLAAMWDVKGDASHLLTLAYSVYVGQVIQGSTDAASPVGNPIDHLYAYTGGSILNADGSLNAAAFGGSTDIRNSTSQFYLNDSFRNRTTTIDPNLKAPRVTEVSIDYKFSDGTGGTFGLNLSKRVWSNFVTSYAQTDPAVIDPATGSPTLYTRIANDSDIKRDYTGLEITYRKKISESLTWGFQSTLSSLRGNFEGGQVGTSDQRHSFGAESQIPMSQLGPMGYLAADRPLQFVGDATYTTKIGKGTLNLGAMQYFTTGTPYSLTATANPASYVPAGYSTDGYTSSYTRYFGDRGGERFPNTYRTDVQIAYDYPLINKVLLFARVNITNFFNHQMQQSWNTTGSLATYNYSGATATPIANPNSYYWMAGKSYGRPTTSADYINARQLNIAGGIRF